MKRDLFARLNIETFVHETLPIIVNFSFIQSTFNGESFSTVTYIALLILLEC